MGRWIEEWNVPAPACDGVEAPESASASRVSVAKRSWRGGDDYVDLEASCSRWTED